MAHKNEKCCKRIRRLLINLLFGLISSVLLFRGDGINLVTSLSRLLLLLATFASAVFPRASKKLLLRHKILIFSKQTSEKETLDLSSKYIKNRCFKIPECYRNIIILHMSTANGGSGGQSQEGGSGGQSQEGGSGGQSQAGGSGGQSQAGGSGGQSQAGGSGGQSQAGGSGGQSQVDILIYKMIPYLLKLTREHIRQGQLPPLFQSTAESSGAQSAAESSGAQSAAESSGAQSAAESSGVEPQSSRISGLAEDDSSSSSGEQVPPSTLDRFIEYLQRLRELAILTRNNSEAVRNEIMVEDRSFLSYRLDCFSEDSSWWLHDSDLLDDLWAMKCELTGYVRARLNPDLAGQELDEDRSEEYIYFLLCVYREFLVRGRSGFPRSVGINPMDPNLKFITVFNADIELYQNLYPKVITFLINCLLYDHLIINCTRHSIRFVPLSENEVHFLRRMLMEICEGIVFRPTAPDSPFDSPVVEITARLDAPIVQALLSTRDFSSDTYVENQVTGSEPSIADPTDAPRTTSAKGKGPGKKSRSSSTAASASEDSKSTGRKSLGTAATDSPICTEAGAEGAGGSAEVGASLEGPSVQPSDTVRPQHSEAIHGTAVGASVSPAGPSGISRADIKDEPLQSSSSSEEEVTATGSVKRRRPLPREQHLKRHQEGDCATVTPPGSDSSTASSSEGPGHVERDIQTLSISSREEVEATEEVQRSGGHGTSESRRGSKADKGSP